MEERCRSERSGTATDRYLRRCERQEAAAAQRGGASRRSTILGKGSFGLVFVDEAEPESAIKRVDIWDSCGHPVVSNIKEVVFNVLHMRDMQSAHVNWVNRVTVGERHIDMHMERMSGTLWGWANETPFLDRMAMMPDVVWQLMLGLASLHEMGLSHGYLKPGNVLFKRSPFTVRLADFGSSAMLDDSDATGANCTYGFRAPEGFGALPAGYDMRRFDVYSLGATIAAVVFKRYFFCGEWSFERAKEFYDSGVMARRISDWAEAPPPPNIPTIVMRLMVRMLDQDHSTRITLAEAMNVMSAGSPSPSISPRVGQRRKPVTDQRIHNLVGRTSADRRVADWAQTVMEAAGMTDARVTVKRACVVIAECLVLEEPEWSTTASKGCMLKGALLAVLQSLARLVSV